MIWTQCFQNKSLECYLCVVKVENDCDMAHMDEKINAHKVLLRNSEETIWK
jgi:hypothetical protein